jgi:surfactin synthase thioesterase subunit
VELPGHNSRHREAPLTNLKLLAAELAGQIVAYLESKNVPDGAPFYLLGASLGAWIAFEVVQALMKAPGKQRVPTMLVVCSNRAPHLAGLAHDIHPVQLSTLPQEDFFAAMQTRYGANPDLVGGVQA